MTVGINDFYDMADAVRTSFHAMTELSKSVLIKYSLTPPQRNVLVELHRDGAKTVPRMAEERPVSRQRMQAVVNALLDSKLVATSQNPEHARSSLIKITDKGKKVLSNILNDEKTLVNKALVLIDHNDLRLGHKCNTAFKKAVLQTIDSNKGERDG